jgi:hypothetical protein
MERIIHQIWVGAKAIPDREAEFIASMKELNTTCEHILWTDNNLPNLPDRILKAYNSRTHPAFKADILRYYVTNKYGGLYIDADFEPIAAFPDYYFEKEYILFHHLTAEPENKHMPNEIFGFSAGCGLSNYICSKITEYNHWFGPSWFSDCIKEFLGLSVHDYPIDVSKRLTGAWVDYQTNKNLYAKHHYLYSWEPK